MEPLKLKTLIQGIPNLKVKGSKEVEITGLTADSNTVAPGNLFIAKKGASSDGSDFIPQAVAAGASAILAQLYDPFLQVSQILAQKPEELEAKLAARFYQNPSENLWVAGVTGTKGKTTTTYLIRHLLIGLGRPTGLIGTVETIVGPKHFPSTFTTHYPIRNQRLLREMISAGCKAAVLEVSSHGLDQGRTEEIKFDAGLFTNLTPDHLDYHKTIEDYAAAKKKLFSKAKTHILNGDSPWADFMSSDPNRMTFGVQRPADVTGSEISFNDQGSSLVVEYRGKKQKFITSLMGRFNVYNLLGAISIGLLQGADLEAIASIFRTVPSIPGRLEQVENDLGFRLLVDFAHSGEALENVLATLREISQKRLIVVFGCGGGRDPARRSGMAAAAEKWADLSVVTSDNPRNEDPNEICRQILAGFQKPELAILEVDRTKAIRLAIDLAREGDVVLIAGKGHERTQIFGSQTIPYDDCLVAKEALQIRQSSVILS